MGVAPKVEIGPATPDHRAFIRAGARATFAEHAARNPTYFTPNRLRGVLDHVDRGFRKRGSARHLVASSGAKPLGYVTLSGFGASILIRDVYVDQGHRREGIAGALLDHTLALARQGRTKFVLATVWDGNDASHALFLSRGFTPQTPLLPVSISRLFPALRSTGYVKALN